MELPPIVEIANRSELLTLPVGRYSIPSERRIEPEQFDIRSLGVLRDAPVIPIAHVLDELPRLSPASCPGLDITVRGDGKVIMSGWMVEESWILEYRKAQLEDQAA